MTKLEIAEAVAIEDENDVDILGLRTADNGYQLIFIVGPDTNDLGLVRHIDEELAGVSEAISNIRIADNVGTISFTVIWDGGKSENYILHIPGKYYPDVVDWLSQRVPLKD